MEVVAGRAAGRAHPANLLAAGDVVAFMDQDCRHVTIAGSDAAAMVDLDKIAVATAVPPSVNHGSVCRGINRRSVGTRKVDPRMKSSAGVERIGPGAEAAGELDVGLDRLVRRDGNDSVLKLIELLPAVEEVLEGGAGGRLEWTADAGSAADPGGRDSKPLQLGGGDLVTDVERFRDQ